jgi:hypothetical protein
MTCCLNERLPVTLKNSPYSCLLMHAGSEGRCFQSTLHGRDGAWRPIGLEGRAGARITILRIFSFFIFFLPQFCKNIRAGKILQNYTSNAVSHGGKGPVCFQIFYHFNLNSDGGKLYMKIVAFDEIKFVVQSFSISSHLHSQIMDKPSRSSSRFPTALDV